MRESWKQIKSFPAYEVSDQGRVRRTGRGIMKTHSNEKGYLRVVLSEAGRQKSFMVHRLVLEAFVGPQPVGLECDHINEIKSDARLVNLRWLSRSENFRRSQHRIPRGEEHGRAKLTKESVLEIRRRYHRTHPTKSNARELAIEFGVTHWTIAAITSGRTWISP